MTASLKLGKTVIPYEERKSSRVKRISIRITPEKVRVTAPARASKSEIQAFIEKNQEWILENWAKLQETVAAQRKVYETGDKVAYLGKELTLQIIPTPHKTISAFYIKDQGILEIKIPQGLEGQQRQKAIQEILEKWYKQKARTIFRQKLNYWSRQMGVSYNQFRLKEQKTRWGSCSSLGNINLNWRAIMATEPVLDYLVIHELSHLLYLDHSPEFWENVARYCPDHAKHRRWLREKGPSLIV